MYGSTREERKAAAYLRAELSLKQAMERIDYDFDVIKPKLEEMRELAKTNNLELEIGGLGEDQDNA